MQEKAQQSERMLAELPAHECSICNSVDLHSASSGLQQDKAQQSERMLAEVAAHIRCSCNSVHLHSVSSGLLSGFCCLAIQDKAQQSERMLAEMAAQMQQLRVEKEELQGRNKLLESLLKVQQQQQHDSSGGRRLDASQVWVQCLLPLSC